MKCQRFESEVPQLSLLRDDARQFTPRMWSDAQFFILDVPREAQKNPNERPTLRRDVRGGRRIFVGAAAP